MPSDEWDEKAREIWKRTHTVGAGESTIAAALRAAERRGIERVAQIADEEGAEWDSDNVQTHKNYAAHVATRARALAPPMAGAGPTEPAGASDKEGT